MCRCSQQPVTISRLCPQSIPRSRKDKKSTHSKDRVGVGSLRSPASSSAVNLFSGLLDDLPQQPLITEISPLKSWLKVPFLWEAT